jgi:hypothetical protein
MRVDEAKRRVAIDRNDAHLLVQFAEPSVLQFAQSDQFDVPTTDPERYPNQWHLQATTVDKSREVGFLAALFPYRTDDEGHLPVVKSLTIAGRHAMEIAWPDGRRDLFAFAARPNEVSQCRLGPMVTDAPAACIRLDKNGAVDTVFRHGGTHVRKQARDSDATDRPR